MNKNLPVAAENLKYTGFYFGNEFRYNFQSVAYNICICKTEIRLPIQYIINYLLIQIILYNEFVKTEYQN